MDIQLLAQLVLTAILIDLGVRGLWLIFNTLRPKSKRKHKIESGQSAHPAIYRERKETYWQERLESARTGVVDAQREYRDTLHDYAKWKADKAVEEAKAARDIELDELHQAQRAELEAAMQAHVDPFADDELPLSEDDNKLIAYLRKIQDEDSN